MKYSSAEYGQSKAPLMIRMVVAALALTVIASATAWASDPFQKPTAEELSMT